MERGTTEAELESFREQWRSEVSTRSRAGPRRQQPGGIRPTGPGRPSTKLPVSERVIPSADGEVVQEQAGRSYHGLEDKEDHLKLENEHIRASGKPKEPTSALEHYEKAVERESQGSLGDSVTHYRKAFKLDDSVQELYRKKHFPPAPPAVTSGTNVNPSNAAATVPNPAHHSLDGGAVPTLAELVDDFSQFSIAGAAPETGLSPPRSCPIAEVPTEVLVEILQAVGLNDVPSFSRLAQTCKRFAYLIMTEDTLWKPISLGARHGILGMHYRYACDVQGKQIHHVFDDDHDNIKAPSPPAEFDLTPSKYPTYRQQFRHRPRLRFNGCYISTVNYTRPGGASQSQSTWNSPVHIVTYYRYLRFFRDGTCISLLTTAEPSDTVYHITKENVHHHHSGLMPSAVMKDALPGRWRLSGTKRTFSLPTTTDHENLQNAHLGPGEYDVEPHEFVTPEDDIEQEGDVHVETEGVIPKYMWKMQFGLGSAGRKDGTRNNKLNWKGFWSYNRLTDDWGEFGLKNDRPYYWSRVKSYNT